MDLLLEIKSKAEAGDAHAQFQLGEHYASDAPEGRVKENDDVAGKAQVDSGRCLTVWGEEV